MTSFNVLEVTDPMMNLDVLTSIMLSMQISNFGSAFGFKNTSVSDFMKEMGFFCFRDGIWLRIIANSQCCYQNCAVGFPLIC